MLKLESITKNQACSFAGIEEFTVITKWDSTFDIGVPEIDAEHRYLLSLVNDFHSAYRNKTVESKIAEILKHLLRYVEVHFRNEESLMSAIDYPMSKQHKTRHTHLEKTSRELLEQYTAGNVDITDETMDFLRGWLYHHILEEDKKIGDYCNDHGFPEDWECPHPDESIRPDIFKTCTFCGKQWSNFDAFLKDKEKSVIGCQPDMHDPHYHLIMFNCSCHTTLAFRLSELTEALYAPLLKDESLENATPPDYCLNPHRGPKCSSACACRYVRDLVTLLG
ncbi:MAG: hypothetical protein C0623_01420 [Desulfuromonas sp.]|nr:MAG: hypothetical protein C0623_01420 [Desulfuromonas sp.]